MIIQFKLRLSDQKKKMTMKVKSNNGVVYEYDYKTILIKKEQYDKVKQESKNKGDNISKTLNNIINYYFNK